LWSQPRKRRLKGWRGWLIRWLGKTRRHRARKRRYLGKLRLALCAVRKVRADLRLLSAG
jgi:hypothetical protein